MPLSDIVNVIITRQTPNITEAGFGIPMILGTNVAFLERIKYYSSIADVALDFNADSLEYVAAQDVFSQTISPNLLAIGKRAVDTLNIDVITGMADVTYTVSVNGVDATVSSTTTATYSQVTLDADLVLDNVATYVVDGGAPIATTWQGSHLATMEAIVDQLVLLPEVSEAFISGPTSRVLTVIGQPNVTLTVNSFVVTLGASQATATIIQIPQQTSKETIAAALVSEINNLAVDPLYPVTAGPAVGETFPIQNKVNGTPLVVHLRTTIGNPNEANVRVTQVKPQQTYTVTINGVNFSYQSPNNIQLAATILDAIALQINTQSAVAVTASVIGGQTLNILALSPAIPFSISVSEGVMAFDKGLTISSMTNANTVVEDLDEIDAIDSSWYGLIYTSRDQAQVESIAGWVETRIKLFGTASNDPVIINTEAGSDMTSIAAVLNQAGYVRTFVMYHQDAAFDFPEAAWFGRVLPLEPGSETWKFKTLNSVSYSNLTTSQSRNALNKRANTYEFVGGVGITANGTVAQGEYIDIIRGVDWLRARIQEFVYRTLVANPKVPYTDAGIAAIQSQVMRVLQLGIDNDFLASDPLPTCTVPRASEVPAADKANRILRNVKFTATLAGAIHAVRISGTLSV